MNTLNNQDCAYIPAEGRAPMMQTLLPANTDAAAEAVASPDWTPKMADDTRLPKLPDSLNTTDAEARSRALDAELLTMRVLRAERETDWAQSRGLCVFIGGCVGLIALILAAANGAGWLP